ncbi:ArpU family phage packaging/lysis transcriptional regulator [Metabacillus litoralis]|uniref:ArpU family phage packaging/lysis transcriptional regulator n=1 Tax=Metabacillus litoralis TaxID=152268 RepID=UPI00203D0145|nr:ArpU family phage packaging/lysis transcriptional regulator [Metabacillus litoralis]MCM3411244.1 ArpU family transcriptional regulator [Metabacillus litoralis]
MKKLSTYLPAINPKATKKEVEKAFEEYRMYLVTLPGDFLPKITPSYSQLPPTFTNQFHSSTEDLALERVEFERVRNKVIKRIHAAVNSLKPEERFIIIKCFMQQDIGYDPDIYLELGIGKTRYYEIKGEAMLRLAFNLHIEVYKKKNEVKSA